MSTAFKLYEEDERLSKVILHKATISAEREEFRYRITLKSCELRWVRSLLKFTKRNRAEGSLIGIENSPECHGPGNSGRTASAFRQDGSRRSSSRWHSHDLKQHPCDRQNELLLACIATCEK